MHAAYAPIRTSGIIALHTFLTLVPWRMCRVACCVWCCVMRRTGLQQGEGVNGAGESEDEACQPAGEDFRKKKSKKLRVRTKLIKSSPDLNSSLGGSDSKRRFLRKGSEKKLRKGSKFPSHSDIVLPVARVRATRLFFQHSMHIPCVCTAFPCTFLMADLVLMLWA